jgi:hypothetical protein
LALWYTEEIGKEGPVFGSNDHWVGLGVFLDSFDNDGQQVLDTLFLEVNISLFLTVNFRLQNNPYIGLFANNGSVSYDHHK